MAIFNRGGYWHYDFFVNKERIRGTTRIPATSQKPPANVRAFVKDLRERAALGQGARGALTLEQVAAKWFIARVAGKRSEKTTARRVKIVLRLIGSSTPISAIDTPEIEDAIQRRRLELVGWNWKSHRAPSNATVNRDMIDSTLRPILRYADKVLKQKVNDIEWTELRLDEPKERTRAFSPDEMAAWRSSLPEWHRPVMDFMAMYGVRLREAFFPPGAFDGERVVIRQRKNGRDHVLPLLPKDRADIAARASRAAKAGLETIWFREMKDGTLVGIHWRAFQSASKAAQKAAGLIDARPAHDLRHHAATAALRRSGSLPAVQRLLGHDNVASTMRYAHANETDVLKALGHETTHNDEAGARKPLRRKPLRVE